MNWNLSLELQWLFILDVGFSELNPQNQYQASCIPGLCIHADASKIHVPCELICVLFELFCAQNYIKRTRTQPTPAETKINEVLDVGICSTSNKAETKMVMPVSAQHQTLLVAKAKWPPLLLLLSINKQRV